MHYLRRLGSGRTHRDGPSQNTATLETSGKRRSLWQTTAWKRPEGPRRCLSCDLRQLPQGCEHLEVNTTRERVKLRASIGAGAVHRGNIPAAASEQLDGLVYLDFRWTPVLSPDLC